MGVDEFGVSDNVKIKGFNTSTFYLDQLFYKTGSRTGLTAGRYNAIEPTVVVTLPSGTVRTTSEHTFVGRATAPGRFNERGDSGSWILDQMGYVVGLLWGGTHSVCYFTPIGLVLADIETRTGMRVELPM